MRVKLGQARAAAQIRDVVWRDVDSRGHFAKVLEHILRFPAIAGNGVDVTESGPELGIAFECEAAWERIDRLGAGSVSERVTDARAVIAPPS